MKRRGFITIAGGAAAWSVIANAQQPAMPVIGFLSAGGPPSAAIVAAFNAGLEATGFVEGRNVSIVVRSTEHYEELATIAAGFARLPVAIIVASGTGNAAIAAMSATRTVPIEFTNGADPVRLGLVASLHRPGGNVTGMTYFSASLTPKRLEIMRELVPSARLFAFLVNPTNSRADADINDMEEAARAIGQPIMIFRASNAAELDATFAAIDERRIGALLVAGDAFFTRKSDQIVALATRYRIPVSHPSRASVDAGGLMSYGDVRSETHRQSGIYSGRILKGEKPADLPVLQPTKYELVFNNKTVKAIGITIPATLQVRADEIVE